MIKKIIALMILFSVVFNYHVRSYSAVQYSIYDKLNFFYPWLTPEIYSHIKYYSNKYVVSEELVCSLIQQESHGRRYAKSKKGARGLMQVMPCHLKKSERRGSLYEYEKNIRLGIDYLSQCLKKSEKFCLRREKLKKEHRGIIQEACRMYNAGKNSSRSKYHNWKYAVKIEKNYKLINNIIYIDNNQHICTNF